MRNDTNPWKGFVTGMIGAVAGLLAMRYYWQKMAPLVKEQLQGLEKYDKNPAQPHPLDSISLVGKQHEEDESSTAAVGRIIYRGLTGSEPESQEAKMMLSYLVHWAYGIFQGGMYGALRYGSTWPDLSGGMSYATGLWILGDEIAVPLLGLQKGPTAYPVVQHLNRWGAHLAYGSALAATTKTLQWLL